MCFPSRWWCWSGIIITISLLHHFGRQCSCPSAERTLPQATPHRILRDNLTTARVLASPTKKEMLLYTTAGSAPQVTGRSRWDSSSAPVSASKHTLASETGPGSGATAIRGGAWPSCASIRRGLLRSGFSLCVCVSFCIGVCVTFCLLVF